MKLDRERFLALALGLAACHHGVGSPVEEGGYGVLDDLTCSGFDLSVPKCVAWKKGKVTTGYLPTDECVRWDDAGRCNANEFVRKGAVERGD